MKGIHLQTSLNVTAHDGKRKIIAYITVVDIKQHAILTSMEVEVDSEAELDEVYNRIEMLYSLTREEL